jgi:hypothetical protein
MTYFVSRPSSRPEQSGVSRMVETMIVSFVRILISGLLMFLFPEAATKYHPEDHYMRGPGPKWKAKHVADRKSASST